MCLGCEKNVHRTRCVWGKVVFCALGLRGEEKQKERDGTKNRRQNKSLDYLCARSQTNGSASTENYEKQKTYVIRSFIVMLKVSKQNIQSSTKMNLHTRHDVFVRARVCRRLLRFCVWPIPFSMVCYSDIVVKSLAATDVCCVR